MCVHVHMCAHMCPCVWRQEVDLKNLPFLLFVLFSETGALTEPGANLVDRMHRMFPPSQHCEGGSVLCTQHCEGRSVLCAQPFLSLLRVWAQVLTLAHQIFYQLSCLPSLREKFVKIIFCAPRRKKNQILISVHFFIILLENWAFYFHYFCIVVYYTLPI